MNKRQTNKLRKYLTIQALLKTTTVTSGLAGLPAKLTALGANIDELNTLATTQTQLTEGYTARRDQQLGDMTDAALDVANAAATHATEEDLKEIAPAVDVTASDFASLRIVHRPWLAQRIHDAATSVLPALATYGVTADTLTDLKAKIDAVSGGLHQPRVTITAKKAASGQLASIFKQADTTLEQIDRLVYPLRKTDPEFYAQYQAASTTVDSRTVHDAPDPAPNATTVPTAAVSDAAASSVTGQKAA